MSKNSKMYESSIATFFKAFLLEESDCGQDLQNFILQLKNSDIHSCDLSAFLEWDDITFYSKIIEIGENHKNVNVQDLARMIIPNLNSFLNMVYSYLDIKNNKLYSTEDLEFLKKIKYLIKSDSQFSKKLRNFDFVKENTLLSTKDLSLSSQIDNKLITRFSFNVKAYKKKEPIYVRDKSGKIYELSKHPDRKCNWDEKRILLQSEYCYIPFLKLNGYSENDIDELGSMFSASNSEVHHSNVLEKKTVNMQPLRIGNNIEDYFLDL